MILGTLPSSDFPGTYFLPGDTLVDLEYLNDTILFGEDLDEIQSFDHLRQQCIHVWDMILSI